MNKDYFQLIRQWAQQRGLYEQGDPKTQCLKLVEEVGELAEAILKNQPKEIIDAVGDIIVVLTNLSELSGFQVEQAIEHAYNEIKDRKGQMKNGTFIKE